MLSTFARFLSIPKDELIGDLYNTLKTTYSPKTLNIFDVTPDTSCSSGLQLLLEMKDAQWPDGVKRHVQRHQDVMALLQPHIESGDVHALSLNLK
ncbi:Sec23/Sec24 trunk domain [Carpediemonas membranifera]|uniref:Sec23/Sec24 trunk domain n=1 Tax=Carpediemonas membranifera TaxID=201153 RepID=A0A8J6B499_9EUKA|nr:Sec23/Sec24 trunk domain [Carpediemonas membranifera]|eukprot:KAG9389727.1 Sec23/Sec24 trunk domain [Carpediemonas membranifera]